MESGIDGERGNPMDWREVNRAPRITVLISSFNNARFVPKKLEEIRRQSCFEDAEFLFLETGSPERERTLFAPFCDRHPNCRVITTDDRRTLYQAWNMGWREAKAPFLCISNMDDAMHPRLLEEVSRAMEDGAAVCTVLIAKQRMDDRWNDWSRDRIVSLPLSTRFGAFWAWRNDLKSAVGEFDERFIAAGDKEFWHRLKQHANPRLLPKILYLYTRNPDSLSQDLRKSDRWKQEKELMQSLRVEWPSSLRWKVRMYRAWRAARPGFGFVLAGDATR